jgi:hypothetical protein
MEDDLKIKAEYLSNHWLFLPQMTCSFILPWVTNVNNTVLVVIKSWPLKFNFNHIMFFSPNYEIDRKYEYFTLLWGTLFLDLRALFSE